MKALVTGGAGFIGSHVVEALLEKGYEVSVIDNLYSGKKANIPDGVIFHPVDITDFNAIAPFFEGIDYVFHLAALPQVPYSIEYPLETDTVNARGTLHVLTAAHNAGVKKVVYSASSAVYGDAVEFPLKESLAPQPKSPYGLQKYMGEVYCSTWSRVYNLSTVSLRYFNVYGPRQSSAGAYASVIARFMDMKEEGKPLTVVGDGSQTRDFVFVKDVARANVMAAESDLAEGEVINIGTGVRSSVLDIAGRIGGTIEYISPRLEPKDSLADITKAKTLLGWEPSFSLKEGIEILKKYEGIE